jgi:hypothetical protein
MKEEFGYYICEPNVVAKLANLFHHQEAQLDT